MDQLNLNNDDFLEQQAEFEPQPTRSTPKWVLFLLAFATVMSVFLYLRFDGFKNEITQSYQTSQNLLDEFKKSTTERDDGQQQQIDSLRADIDSQSNQLGMQAELTALAKRDALVYTEKQAQLLTEQLINQQEQNNQKFNQMNSVTTDLAQKTETVYKRIAEVNDDVVGVKNNLSKTITALDETRAEFSGAMRKVQGDLGVTNGYLATNTQELAELKRRGERNYVEFTVKKQRNSQRVGDFNIWLDDVNSKRSRYTLLIMNNNQLVEKRGRNLNEPLQLYRGHDLYEFVVNSISKDSVTGYLSGPKNVSK